MSRNKEILGEVLVIPQKGNPIYGELNPHLGRRLMHPVIKDGGLNQYGQNALDSSIEIPEEAEIIPFTNFALKMHGYEVTLFSHPNFGGIVKMSLKHYMSKWEGIRHGGYNIKLLELTQAQQAALATRRPATNRGHRGSRYR